MKTVVALATCILLMACGCDRGKSAVTGVPSTVPTATPETVRFEVAGPVAADSLGPGKVSVFATYVYGSQTQQVHTIEVTEIHRNTAERPIMFAGWTVAGTLRFIGSVGSYEVTLDGKATPAQFVPRLEGDPSEPAGSADGAWLVTRAGDALLVANVDASSQFRLAGSNVALEWAPAGHLAAFGTGPCHGGDLYVFDPDEGTLNELTGSGNFVLDWTWHPEGTRIAANFMGEGESGIAIVDAVNGTRAIVVPSNGGGEFAPLEWSDDGRYLAFRFRGGRDFGCGEGATEPPYVAPALERLR